MICTHNIVSVAKRCTPRPLPGDPLQRRNSSTSLLGRQYDRADVQDSVEQTVTNVNKHHFVSLSQHNLAHVTCLRHLPQS